ncbi:aldehyde dehydrogenase [Halalkalibacter wakoensis JCM 9140]|uniref:3-sulfolactaldehyde dehydrogenase n=1 Tax=Halalkalibacter wakoensis JCM 9140 TaxID=1236970 RepID=W4Q7J6_9BACI|nr:aldehyde dehydrogenase family protein [Halalkalibacter wakoensis]GAE28051.1 aldehyde dehydrogenase [Halalkalibacter wakoensis JCM 9140]
MKYSKWNQMYIDGTWREGTSDKTFQNDNPYSGEIISEIKLASKADVDEAYEAAKNGQQEWEKTPAIEKTKIIEKAISIIEERSAEFAEILIEEAGSSALKANVELHHIAIAFMKEAATYPLRMHKESIPSIISGKENTLTRLPVGVVGVISPWNFPFHLTMRSVVSALATGNGVVLKPATFTYISGGLLLADIFEKAGLPKGLLNVVVGSGSEIGDYMVEHPIPRMISFTGSTEVGQRIGRLAGGKLKKTALELGGNNVFIVLDDADIEQAVSAAVFGKFMHQGQICMAINRFIVDRKVYSKFVELFTAKAKEIKVGDPADKETIIGPLIERKQVDRILSLIDKSLKQGAKLELEGEANGNLLSPYILTDVTNDMEIAQEEIFGPVAVVIPVEGEEEAVAIANDSEFGLSGAVFSGSTQRGVKVAEQIHTGMIHVNDQTVNDEPHIAFGGEKASGLGRFNGEWALEEFTTVKWISIMHQPRNYPFS